MASPDIIVGEYGKKIVLDTSIDLSDATSVEMHYRRPDGASGVLSAQTDPDNNTWMYITIEPGFIDQHGVWTFHAAKVITGASRLIGRAAVLSVRNLFERN
jgi:hypothetical protein